VLRYAWPARRRYDVTTKQRTLAAIAHYVAAVRRGDYTRAQRREIAENLRWAAAHHGIEIRAPEVLR